MVDLQIRSRRIGAENIRCRLCRDNSATPAFLPFKNLAVESNDSYPVALTVHHVRNPVGRIAAERCSVEANRPGKRFACVSEPQLLCERSHREGTQVLPGPKNSGD